MTDAEASADAAEAAPVKMGKKRPKLPTTPWLLPGVLIAVLALAGVLAGGYVSTRAQNRQSTREQAAVVSADRREAAGAARLMSVEYRVRAGELADVVKSRRFPTRRTVMASGLSIDDQRTVASAMAPRAWAAVADAGASLGDAQRLLDHTPGGHLTHAQRTSARGLRKSFASASTALSGFAAGVR